MYIGKTPTSVPLTSSDITDGIITTTKIADANVTNPKLTSGSQQNFRNIIINGDMSIAQRATSVSSITSDNAIHTLDRYRTRLTTLGTWTQSQSTTVPSGQGFATSLKMDCTSADASPAAGDRLFITQRFEGQMLQYLKKGTSNAQSLTLSFWVRSNKTGTYICELFDQDNSRHINKSYTISVANTWEKKEITFAGDTTGAFGNDNANSLECAWWLGAGTTYTSGTLQTSWGSSTNANRAVGQVNLADSTSNEWYVTGVQLEAGTTASDFEFLPVDVNLRRCQRYYYLHADGASSNKRVFSGGAYNGSLIDGTVFFPTTMRANPTLEAVSGTDYYKAYGNGTNDAFNDFVIEESNINSAGIRNSATFSGTQGMSYFVITISTSAKISFNSEL